MNKTRLWLGLGVLVALLAALWVWRARGGGQMPNAPQMALLLPDGTDSNLPMVRLWSQTASEEGFPLQILYDNDLAGMGFQASDYAGIIVPDTLHPVANDNVITALRSYVKEGGHLMLAYDAATWERNGVFRTDRSALSDLVGVDYALYTSLRSKTIARGPVLLTRQNALELEIQPGKTSPFGKDKKLQAISAYEYRVANYPSFVTRGNYRGQTLLSSPQHGLIAGYNALEKGGVLFVNLPLGYFKQRTDGLFMHTFLRYFAHRVLDLPRTSPMPSGIGGLTMNWHIDSNADFKPLFVMKSMGFYQQGPYSMHITAGPDVTRFGDKKGLDVPRNLPLQKWIRERMREGHEIGCHGGWIHNFYGNNVNENNRARFQKFLELNKSALEKVTGKPMREYSAPEGNQPVWATEWLDKNGFTGYYFTGNTGLGPTLSFRDGQPADLKIWSFPIATLGDDASFAEFAVSKISDADVALWLREMSDFAVRNNTNRLIYFHPNDIVLYPKAMKNWLAHTAMLRRAGTFRWYTMAQLASFLNARKAMKWSETRDDANKTAHFEASSEQALTEQTWFLSRARYGQPRIESGQAQIRSNSKQWIIVAKSGNALKFAATFN